MENEQVQNFAFIGLFGAITFLLFLVFLPFLHILALAAVFALLLQMPYEYLLKHTGGLKSLSAGAVVCAVLVFFIVPIFFLGTQIFLEAQSLYAGAASGAHYVQIIQNAITHVGQRFSPTFTFSISQYVGSAFSYISGTLASLVSGTLYILFETFLMLLAFFFLLRDGKTILASAKTVSPFGVKETDIVLKRMSATIQTIVKGTLLVALIRWVFIGLAFYIFGIPNAVLWGSLGGLVGAIPGVGALFVFVPSVLYLYVQGSIVSAIGLAVVGLLVILFVDNMLTTYFFGKGLEVPQILILFSILGGIIFFGPVGFIMGPLVLSVFVSLLDIYRDSK